MALFVPCLFLTGIVVVTRVMTPGSRVVCFYNSPVLGAVFFDEQPPRELMNNRSLSRHLHITQEGDLQGLMMWNFGSLHISTTVCLVSKHG
jgi:hypothetical protein